MDREEGSSSRFALPDISDLLFRSVLNGAETRLLRMRLATAVLRWGDACYRRDDAASRARARELYKSALWLLGERPPSDPDGPRLFWGKYNKNPAVQVLLAQARRGLEQIALGLNFYGYAKDHVPAVDYLQLLGAARRAATDAKAVQSSFGTRRQLLLPISDN